MHLLETNRFLPKEQHHSLHWYLRPLFAELFLIYPVRSRAEIIHTASNLLQTHTTWFQYISMNRASSIRDYNYSVCRTNSISEYGERRCCHSACHYSPGRSQGIV